MGMPILVIEHLYMEIVPGSDWYKILQEAPFRRNTLQWRHNGHDGVSNHQPHQCLLNRLFRRRSQKASKLRVTGLCAGNSPGTGEFPAQMASNAENVSIWWRHHEMCTVCTHCISYSDNSVLPERHVVPLLMEMRTAVRENYNNYSIMLCLTYWHLGDEAIILKVWFSNSFYRTVASAIAAKFLLAWCHRTTLTHWGRMTHMCVSKLTIIGWDNGLSPGRRQAIIWTNAGILLVETLGTKFSEI